MDLEKIVAYALSQNASDIHISAGKPVFIRSNGALVPVGQNPLAQEHIEQLIQQLLTPQQIEFLESRRQMDFVTKTKAGLRLRGNVFFQEFGMAVVFRIIPDQIVPFSSLQFPNFVNDYLMRIKNGLVLVVGPTGEGKSTTIASILQERGIQSTEHVITVEDPVEYLIPSQKGLVQQREVRRDVHTFKDGMNGALREDPDVVMVGEMRDYETISTTLTMAETGHLVFSTLHTNNGTQTISRILDMAPGDQQGQVRAQLSSVLKMIISQRLVPTADGKGRALAYEILTVNYAVQNYIRQDKVFQIPNALETDSSGKMVRFEQSLLGLVLNQKISKEMALAYAENPEKLEKLMTDNMRQ